MCSGLSKALVTFCYLFQFIVAFLMTYRNNIVGQNKLWHKVATLNNVQSTLIYLWIFPPF